MSIKVHDDQLRDKDTGSPPLKYSPSVLVSTLPESWLIQCDWSHTVTIPRTPQHHMVVCACRGRRHVRAAAGLGFKFPGRAGHRRSPSRRVRLPGVRPALGGLALAGTAGPLGPLAA